MKEIVFRREDGYINTGVNYKVVIENGETIPVGNGESKKVQLDNLPTKVYAKQSWFRSKEITIDNSTSEVILKNEKFKSWMAVTIGAPLLMTGLLPRHIWDDSSTAHTVSMVGFSIVGAWLIYAFLIQRGNWILIDKKTSD
jgi:hypothetical protein